MSTKSTYPDPWVRGNYYDNPNNEVDAGICKLYANFKTYNLLQTLDPFNRIFNI